MTAKPRTDDLCRDALEPVSGSAFDLLSPDRAHTAAGGVDWLAFPPPVIGQFTLAHRGAGSADLALSTIPSFAHLLHRDIWVLARRPLAGM